jgi:hypothetical protein
MGYLARACLKKAWGSVVEPLPRKPQPEFKLQYWERDKEALSSNSGTAPKKLH